MAKRKKNNKAGLVLFVAVMLLCTAAVMWYVGKPKFVRYPGFGIDIPVNYNIHGIDVSHYQSSINWDEVKAMHEGHIKIGFAFIKATEGSNDTDDRFKRNWRLAKEAGVARGAYHFFNPYSSGRQQAKNFIETVKLQPGDLPPVLDVEQQGNVSKEVLQQRIGEWLSYVEAYYKVRPIIYTGATFYSNYLSGRFDAYPLWVAHYLVKDKPRVHRPWSFWQHNETGRVNGINAFVDFNVFNGDSADFTKLLVK